MSEEHTPTAPALLKAGIESKHPGLAEMKARLAWSTILNHAAGRTSPDLPAVLAYEKFLGIPPAEWLAPAGRQWWGLTR